MQALNLPKYEIKLKNEGGKEYIFDKFRKKFLRFTPEEWVRQNFLHYLIYNLKYPESLISIEAKVEVNGHQKRYDAVGYNKNGHPFLLVECKAPDVNLSQRTFDQAAGYNFALNVKYIIVTNGRDHYCCTVNNSEQRYVFLEEFPDFSLLV